MRIAILTPEYHTESYRAGGISRHVPKVVHWLADQGHEVSVFVPSSVDECFEERPGVEVIRFLWVPWRLQNYRWPWTGGIGSFFRTWMAFKRIEKEHAKQRFDVVHAFEGRLAYWVAKRGSVPLVLRSSSHMPTYYRTNFETLNSELKRFFRMERATLKRTKVIYTSSQYNADLMRRDVGKSLAVIRTPMFKIDKVLEDAGAYSFPDHYFVFCGGMMGCKGAHVLAEAAVEVLEENPELKLLIFGRDEPSPQLNCSMEQYMRDVLNSVSSQVEFRGVVEHSELSEAINRSVAALIPSIHDNLPNVLLEAMYEGMPIIGSRGASIDEVIVDEEHGLLVELGSVESLREAMRVMLSWSTDKRSELGHAARLRAETLFHPDVVMPQLVQLYEDAIKG